MWARPSGNLIYQTDPVSGSTLYLGDTELHVGGGGVATGVRTYSDGTTPVAERSTTTAGTATVSWLCANSQGTSDLEINAATLAPTRRYEDPYGNPRTGAPTPWSSLNNFLNAPQDTLAGTTQLGVRSYDSAAGRFLTVDPVLDTANPQQDNGYSYALNNPVSTSDPTGMDPPPVGCQNTACYNCLYNNTDCGQSKQAPPPAAPGNGSGGSNSSSGPSNGPTPGSAAPGCAPSPVPGGGCTASSSSPPQSQADKNADLKRSYCMYNYGNPSCVLGLGGAGGLGVCGTGSVGAGVYASGEVCQWTFYNQKLDVTGTATTFTPGYGATSFGISGTATLATTNATRGSDLSGTFHSVGASGCLLICVSGSYAWGHNEAGKYIYVASAGSGVGLEVPQITVGTSYTFLWSG